MTDRNDNVKTLDTIEENEEEKPVLVDQAPSLSPTNTLMQTLQENFNNANIEIQKAIDAMDDARVAYEITKEKKLKAYELVTRAQNELFTNRLSLLQNQNTVLVKRLKSLTPS